MDLETSPSPSRSEGLWRLAPAGPALLALVLGALTLGSKPLWYDETYNAYLVGRPWRELLHVASRSEPAQALYLVLLKPWSELVGASDATLRIPSVIFAAGAAAAVTVLGRELLGRRAGLLAGLLLATNGFVVAWSQQARTYAFAVLAVTVTSLLFVQARRSGSTARWAAYGIAAGLAPWCHFYVAIVVVAQLLTLLQRPRPPRRPVAVAAGIALLGWIPLALYVVDGTRENVEWIPSPSLDVVATSLHRPSGSNPLLLAAAVAGVVVLVRSRRGPDGGWRLTLLVGWVALPLLIGTCAAVFRPFLVPRYAIVIAPALALLAAAALDRIGGRRIRVAAVVAVLTIGVWQTVDWYRRTPSDWRKAGELATTAHARGATVVLIPPGVRIALERYAPDVPLAREASGKELLTIVSEGASDDAPGDVIARKLVGEEPYALVERFPLGDDLVALLWKRR